MCSSVARASSIDGQTVTFSKLMEVMLRDIPEHVSSEHQRFEPSTTTLINIRDVKVRFIRAIDQAMDDRFAKGGSRIIIPHHINFYNVDFDVEFWWLMRNIEFTGRLSFFNCSNLKAIIQECEFKDTPRFYNNSFNFIFFDNCNFYNGFKQSRTTYSDYLKFSACTFTLSHGILKKDTRLDMDERLFILSSRDENFDLTLEACRFILPDSLRNHPNAQVNLSASTFGNLRINNCEMRTTLNLSQSAVSNQFSSYGCTFNGYLLTDAFNFNANNAKVQWATLAGSKLAIAGPDGKPINGKSVTALREEFYFNSLVACYANFYTAFKTQGNRLAANACYVEWKDIETIYLDHIRNTRYTFYTQFSWLMNVFLKTFCDYGTNPIRSIEWSLWVMLAFATFYFFFPYQSGLYKEEGFYHFFLLYVEHLGSKRPLTEVFDEQQLKRAADPSSVRYRELLQAHRQQLPLYLRLLGFNPARIRQIGNHVYRSYLQWLDRVMHERQHNKGWRDAVAETIYALTVLATLLYIIAVRSINSLTLSLNAFSTLGFGEIPVLGMARYLAIIEGFIGWFLLSIFSVALISQIIQ